MKIVESVRDAIQGVQEFIPTQQKIEYINLLLQVGFDIIDYSSFVSKRHIPQLADAVEVLDGLKISESRSKLLVLVGSKKGGDIAAPLEKIDYIAYPFSVSETFLKYNLNCDFIKSVETIEYIQNLCKKAGKELILYIAMAFGNPYGDKWNVDLVFEWIEKFRRLGIAQISFSDPAAVATSENIAILFSKVKKEYLEAEIEFGAHLHSQEDNWFEKVDAAYNNGCRRFDTVINGFGGCPMSKKKLVGNLKTGDLLNYLVEKNQNYDQLDMIAYQIALERANEIFPV